jgi:putative DNA primase/helicase
MSRLTLEAARRAQTWNLAIAATILGPDVPFQDLEHDRHWDGLGGFSVDRRDGAWWCFGTEEGGYSAVALARFLLKGSAWGDAMDWVLSFITAHPGTGSCDGEVAEDDAGETRARISAFRARRIIADRIPIDGTGDTASERYLRSLPIELPYPLPLYRLPNARVGEEAIVVDLVASGRPVAVQLTYIDALDTRSVHRPDRQRFNLEPRRPDAVIQIAAAEPGAVEVEAERIYVEGFEKGLAVYQVKKAGWAITALPGIGALQHQKPERPGERVIVFRDGDPKDSPADKALAAGVDALILAGATVRVTETPPGASARSLLQDPKQGKKALRRLLAKPAGAALSFNGKVTELAGLPETAYEQARREAAKAHKVRTAYLDKEVATARKRLKPLPSAPEVTEEPPWTGDIDLAAALDGAVAAMAQFVVAPAYYFDIMALWGAATHLVQPEELAVPIMPQLGFQSIAVVGSSVGKSKAMASAVAIAYRGETRGSYTASTVFRSIHAKQTTFGLPDLHNTLLPDNKDLKQILQACHQRDEAKVDRTITPVSGEPQIRTYTCWAALTWTSIGPLPIEVQNRAIILPMRPALPDELKKLDESLPLRCPALGDVRRHLAVWADTVHKLPRPDIPDILSGREANNWRVLFQVAALAGEAWLARCTAAARALLSLERPQPRFIRLLADIKAIFDARKANRLSSQELIAALLEDPEAGWGEQNHGRGVNEWWLREQFPPGLLQPNGSQRWWKPNPKKPAGREQVRGYLRKQFADPFARYLPNKLFVLRPSANGSSDTSGPKSAEKAQQIETKEPSGSRQPDPAAVHPSPADQPDPDSARKKPSKSAISPELGLDVSDEKGNGRGRRAKPKPNGVEPELGLPPPSVPPYQPGALEEEIRRLHREHPKRSIAWLGKQTLQPRSVIKAILEADGGAE